MAGERTVLYLKERPDIRSRKDETPAAVLHVIQQPGAVFLQLGTGLLTAGQQIRNR
jgi:hypothetical protein